MPDYRRNFVPGACYFFTEVTYGRHRWLCRDFARRALREAIVKARRFHPFVIEAWVLLPDHLHCLWTLPDWDSDYSKRWRLIKSSVTTDIGDTVGAKFRSSSRRKRRERSVWQRRFWEHTIRNEEDFRIHCDYIHYNPVKHGLCAAPKLWPYSSFHRFVRERRYELDWGSQAAPAGIERVVGE
jgi:putative transposase